MKIYLLMLLIGALFTAIRFTSPQEQQSRIASAVGHARLRQRQDRPPLPEYLLTSFLGTRDSSLSMRPGSSRVGALPPFTARTSTRIAGRPASP